MIGDERFDSHKYSIWNFLEANASTITLDNTDEIAAIDMAASISVPKMKVAIVACDNHIVELCKHFIETTKVFGNTWECNPFDSMEDTMNWAKA